MASPRLLQISLARPLPHQAQFELAHRAFQSQEQPIVEDLRIIDPVIVNNEGLG